VTNQLRYDKITATSLRRHPLWDMLYNALPSVLWRCWLGDRKGIRPVKKLDWWGTGVVICLERGADLHMAQLMPLPLTVSCSSKIQTGFTFLVLAHPGSPGQRAVKQVCVCVCVLQNLPVTNRLSYDRVTATSLTTSFMPTRYKVPVPSLVHTSLTTHHLSPFTTNNLWNWRNSIETCRSTH